MPAVLTRLLFVLSYGYPDGPTHVHTSDVSSVRDPVVMHAPQVCVCMVLCLALVLPSDRCTSVLDSCIALHLCVSMHASLL